MTPSQSGRLARISLAGTLAIALLVDLLLDRLGEPIAAALPDVAIVQRLVEPLGRFACSFVSALALLLGGIVLAALLRRKAERSSGAASAGKALTLAALGGFLVIESLGLVVPLPSRLFAYGQALFAFLVVQLALVALGASLGRARLWVTLLLAAALLHVAWVLAHLAQLDRGSGVPRLVGQLGEAVFVALLVAAPLCLPARRSLLGVPLVIGAIVGSASVALGLTRFAVASRLVAAGVGLELPSQPSGIAIYAVALGAVTAAVTALVARGGASRLEGFGVAIVALAGYELESPYQTLSMVIGLYCLVEARLSADPAGSVDEEGWRRLGPALAAFAGAAEVLRSGPPLAETLHVRGSRGTHAPAGNDPTDREPLELVARRHGGRLHEIELAVGFAPAGERPPLSLHSRAAARLGRRDGVAAPTGDVAFDAAVTVWDARGLEGPDPVFADALRPRIAEHVTGWLGVWPGRGARFRSRAPSLLASLEGGAVDAALAPILALLVDVRDAGGSGAVDS